ncbi:transglutaminase-like cysteine peptidase [Qipengyuania soli]|uniref:Transglutaminase-like cysteine peptidase n=1 Tax=Qipengyuania soli TaxID=2782568 RepID=A0A7S8F3B1_9SPHN|nr:transglutaminase-like cysteine peptidase [Qipengyuania soli]QPC98459.1 transglutaminase-like cysteine peptidase [Qipengyuania soli]
MVRPEHFRNALRNVAAASVLAAGGVALPAQAQGAAPLLMPAMTAALANVACPVSGTPVIPTQDFAAAGNLTASKASAILGGGTSELERIRAEQTSFESLGSLMPQAGPTTETVSVPVLQPLAPASAAFAKVVPCSSDFGGGTSGLVSLKRIAPAAGLGRDDFLSSRKVALGRTSFDSAWARVSREKARLSQVPADLVSGSGGIEQRLEAVNRWVNHRITYTDDRKLFGKADFWAGPRKTLQLGKGDCEDYALLKMHLLAAAGVRREDMFLTIARDLVRRADHAVLIIRTDDGYRMLDNATDQVLDATLANDYQPVLSFNDRRTWLHGS